MFIKFTPDKQDASSKSKSTAQRTETSELKLLITERKADSLAYGSNDANSLLDHMYNTILFTSCVSNIRISRTTRRTVNYFHRNGPPTTRSNSNGGAVGDSDAEPTSERRSRDSLTDIELPHVSEPEREMNARVGSAVAGESDEIEAVEMEVTRSTGGHSDMHPLQVLRQREFWTLFVVGLVNLIAINMYSNTWKVLRIFQCKNLMIKYGIEK